MRRARPGRREGHPSPAPQSTDVAETFPWCLEQNLRTRPQYLWGTLLAVRIAKAIGLPRIGVAEFGVAGGNGLLALEQAADAAAELVGVEVQVYGFDGGSGMPAPRDHRDVPWLIEPGWFELDEPALRERLTSAELVLGPVAETVPAFLGTDHAPIGFAAFDLDYYSSTMEAFALLDADGTRLLPRLPCYFDDVFGYGWSDFNGERAAIRDFNAAHDERKLGKIHGLRYSLPASQLALPWHEQMYLMHAFDHPHYSTHEGALAEGWLAAHRLAPES
jgi:hypothetical protein